MKTFLSPFFFRVRIRPALLLTSNFLVSIQSSSCTYEESTINF